MSPPTSAASVDSVPKSEPRNVMIVLKLWHFIAIQVVVMLIPTVLLGRVYLEVDPFFNRYQVLSQNLDVLQKNLTDVNAMVNKLTPIFSEIQTKIDSNNKNMENLIDETSKFNSKVKESADSIVAVNVQIGKLLTDQKSLITEIDAAAKSLKNEQNLLIMITSQNNAIQAGITMSIQRLKEAEFQLQAINTLIITTHRK